jgi:crotonobetainyl-CoA:carnitine CoA-transferase CaiB-like acyl-CoA transferase
MNLPLSGVRVVDLSRLLPGAFATLMLAELGAEVIKIEDPKGGDPMRRLPPLVNGRGIYDLLLNRGKKSVALDLKQQDQMAAARRLIATADVVVESFRPGTARRLGVSAAQVRGQHPSLIHCAITGYGQTGPYAERPGHDLNYVAVSGLLSADERPAGALPRMFMADVGGGAMTAAVGILAALVGRGRTGEGASLDISMHEAALYWVMLPAARALVDGGDAAAGELPTFGAHACYNVYRTRDGGEIALGALEPKFGFAFCEAVGRSDLVPRQLGDGAEQAAVIDEVRAIFATRTRDEWLAFFEHRDVCVTPVNTPAEALADPHVVARGTVGRGVGLSAIRAPFVNEGPALAPAPAVGAHTTEVLAGLGVQPASTC